MVHFDECKHDWNFHANAENTFARGVSFYRCKICQQMITLEEKCALEQTEIANKALQQQIEFSQEQIQAQEKSLKIQERSVNIARWATIITAGTALISFLVFLFGEKIMK